MAIPTGYSGATAIAMVRDRTDEQQQPTDQKILNFLNAGVEQVVGLVNGIKKTRGYYTVNNQTVLKLDDDVQEIIAANFSSGASGPNGSQGNPAPTAQGALVYPMVPLAEAQFMDAAAGFPAVGFGPPQAWLTFQDEGYAPGNTLDPPPAPLMYGTKGISSGAEIGVVLTYVNANGETTASDEGTFTPSTIQNATTYSPPAQRNAQGYNVYVGNPGGPWYLRNYDPIPIGTAYVIKPIPLWNQVNWNEFSWYGPRQVPLRQTKWNEFTWNNANWAGGAGSLIQPPLTNTATGSGTGGALDMQLYPASMYGQVNLYYRARPQLWADTSVTSWTNLDTLAQEAALLWAIINTLFNRSRSDEAINIWKPQYDEKIEQLKSNMQRRTQPRSGQVRDVRGRSYPSAPYWMTSP